MLEKLCKQFLHDDWNFELLLNFIQYLGYVPISSEVRDYLPGRKNLKSKSLQLIHLIYQRKI